VAAGGRGEQPARRAAIAGPAHRGYRRAAESWLLHAGVSAASWIAARQRAALASAAN